MPKVKGMKFPYTEEGMKEAQKYKNSLSPEQEKIRSIAMDTLLAHKERTDALRAQIAEMGMKDFLSSKRIVREPGKPKMGRRTAAYDKYIKDKTYGEWIGERDEKMATRTDLIDKVLKKLKGK